MHRAMPTSRATAVAITVVLLMTATGCAQTKGWWTGVRNAISSEKVILGAPDADQYIQEMYELAAGDAAAQAEIYADAQSAAKLTRGPSTRLRYALVLATPGHAESNPQEAQSVFRELLAQTELMTPAETALATIHLKSVEQQIVLGTETRRARQGNAQRIATVKSENKELRSSLDETERRLEEAERKLEAITSIERSIREQSGNGQTRN